jgi:hypothetical protein
MENRDRDELLKAIFPDGFGTPREEYTEEYTEELPHVIDQSFDFKVEYCELCGWFIRCPRCGNNSCNAGYGDDPDTEDGKCPVCPVAYDLQKILGEKNFTKIKTEEYEKRQKEV